MPRGMVGLLAAVAAAMSAVIGLAHGVLFWAAVVDAAAAAGLAAYLALPPTKKRSRLRYLQILMLRNFASAPSFMEAQVRGRHDGSIPSIGQAARTIIQLIGRTIWMQTTGAVLLAIKRCSLQCTWLPAQDGRSAPRLLYLAAVRDDGYKPEHWQDQPSFDAQQAALSVPMRPKCLARMGTWQGLAFLRLRLMPYRTDGQNPQPHGPQLSSHMDWFVEKWDVRYQMTAWHVKGG